VELIRKILLRAATGERITDDEWMLLWDGASLYELGKVAHTLRLLRADPTTVTFIIDRNINYTNECVSGCAFCAFFRKPGSEDAYLLTREELYKKVEGAKQLGATQILLQGGLHPDLDITFFTGMLRFIKENFHINVHGFSPPEIVHIARNSKMSVDETLRRLADSGLDSIPGGGAEILDDRVRSRISPHKISASEWIEVMRKAHGLGLPTTATMMFGSVEGKENILNHLRIIRELQDETGGFTAFIPWCFQPKNTELSRSYDFVARENSPLRGVPGYLRILVLSRIYLDNVKNFQVSWVTMGLKVAQIALFFGANDFGSLMIEENVVRAAGVSYRLDKEDILDAIRDAGFNPAVRNTTYRILYSC
jgi:cyclic dehypoxanthinyl futalosine synthase